MNRSQKHIPLIGNLHLKAGYGSINTDPKAYIHFNTFLKQTDKTMK